MATDAPFDGQPTLCGPTLELRPIRPDDFDALFEAARDPAIWEQHSESDRYQLPVFERFFQGAIACKGGLVVIDRASRRVIGSSRFYDWDPMSRSVVLGYTFLARSHWGGSTNRELKSLMLGHAFRSAEIAWFHVSLCNLRSQRALAKIGARLDRKEIVPVGGVPMERLIYRIDRKDWSAAHPPA